MWMGIDTSAYTTSLAIIDEDGYIDLRRRLKVKKGEIGLRQSEAVFQHIKNFPEIFEELKNLKDIRQVKAIAVSERPRPVEGSYMPVFETGLTVASLLGSSLNVPVYRVSHQENHIEAILTTAHIDPKDLDKPFLAVHFSGGTSEIVKVKITDSGYDTEIKAKSLDLKAGQLIDRIGVLLGLDFPAGKELEKLALEGRDSSVRIPSRLTGTDFHFSGQETHARRLLKEGTPPSEVAHAVFLMIAKTLERSLRKICENENLRTVVLSGGVMSSTFIQELLRKNLEPAGFRLIFDDPNFSSDNALGNAALAKRIYEKD